MTQFRSLLLSAAPLALFMGVLAMPAPLASATEDQSSDPAPQEELIKPPMLEDVSPETELEAASETLTPDEVLPAETEEAPEERKGRNAHLSPADLALVEAVSAYFNDLTTMSGDFDQQNQDGSISQGTFHLQRPGRMRFEYETPALTLLSDGLWVMLNDREIESVDRYPLRETPLHLILKKTVNLAKDAQIVRVEREGDLIGVTAREEEGIAQGDLTLVFAAPRLELRHWMVEDVQGNRTVVSLRNVQTGRELSPDLFKADEYEFGVDTFAD